MGKIRVTLVRSAIGRVPKHRKTLVSLGLRKTGQSNELPDTPDIRGKIFQVGYLLTVEEIKK